jgi:hypothetical protein
VPRTFFLCAALAAFPLYARAEPTITPTEMLIQLNVQPMPEPKPALRYLLLPELKEMEPGNPIANYLRCLLDQDLSSPVESLRASALRQADRAARMDKPDWQILLKSKTDGIGLLLPDVQKMRTLAGALQERFRTEVNQGHFNDALRTAKTMFALSRHMGENPTLIGDLVGIAIATLTIVPLEEMLAKPGCPNLYWALTNLPSPLVPMEKGWEGERLLIAAELRQLDENAPMSTEQLDKLIAHIDFLRGFDDRKPKKTTRAWLKARNKDEKSVQAARRRLVDVGLSEERLARFPANQVLLLDEKREYEVMRDEALKLMNLRTWQVEALSRQIKPPKKENLFAFLVPSFMKVRQAQGRLEQRIALLRHVEALRLYAADHEDKLPDKLSDCAVPLPEDPFTGKPFRYRKEADKAHLFGAPPRGLENNAAFNLHYEITIQKVAEGRGE